jgi:hypothetical protein
MSPLRADLTASKTDQIVNIDKKWIGLNGPITLIVWIQKLLTLTHNINNTQEYPRYLWEFVPLGLDSWMPPKITAKKAAKA